MLIVPTLQKPVARFFSGDPALLQPDPKWDKKKRADYERKLERARETGDPKELLVGGMDSLTLFHLEAISGDQYRKLHKAQESGGTSVMLQLAFRCALREIENCGELKVTFVEDKIFGQIADVAVCNELDKISPRIVNELGQLAVVTSIANGGISPHR